MGFRDGKWEKWLGVLTSIASSSNVAWVDGIPGAHWIQGQVLFNIKAPLRRKNLALPLYRELITAILFPSLPLLTPLSTPALSQATESQKQKPRTEMFPFHYPQVLLSSP